MSETFVGTVPMIGIVILAIACWFYMWGGRSGKWKRRFIGSLLCATSLWVEFLLLGHFKFILLLFYPLTIAVFVLGYGEDVWLLKIQRRVIVVAASLVTGVGICLLYGNNTWFVLPAEIFISMITVYLGVKNPIQAAAEEYFICLFLWTPKLMYPFALNIV